MTGAVGVRQLLFLLGAHTQPSRWEQSERCHTRGRGELHFIEVGKKGSQCRRSHMAKAYRMRRARVSISKDTQRIQYEAGKGKAMVTLDMATLRSLN